MKAHRSLLSRIASAFRKPKPKAKAHKSVKEPKNRGIECLEGRIAPATLIDASTIQYKDVGGDIVTIHFSKALFTIGTSVEQTITLNKLDDIFKFSGGTTFASDVEQDLQLLDLTKVKLSGTPPTSPVNGISFTIDAETPTGGAGDSLVKVGAIYANNLNLGHVAIDGDLGQIDVGRPSSKVALKSLTVESLYAYEANTQVGTVTPADALESRIVGGVGLLEVKGDLRGYFHLLNGNSIVGNTIKTTAPGNLDKAIIHGSLRGKMEEQSTSDNTGSINAQGKIGTIQVLGSGEGGSTGGLIGGGGRNSGSITGTRGIDNAYIADSIVGKGGLNSGTIVSGGVFKKIVVGDDVSGGAGDLSGSIQGTTILSVSIADSVTGAGGSNSGSVISAGKLSKIEIANDLTGGTGQFSGNIRVNEIGSVTIGGSVSGNVGPDSGMVYSTQGIKSVTIAGDIEGGVGTNSGGVLANGPLQSVTVNGSVIGSVGSNSGFIGSLSKVGSVKVIGSIEGGEGQLSGRVYSAGNIEKVSAAKLVGGIGLGSGSILGASDLVTGGSIKSVIIEQGLQGGVGPSSGTILSLDDIGKVTIGTKVLAAGLVGGDGDFSGSIIAKDSIGKSGGKPSGLLIYGSVAGGTGDQSGLVEAGGNAGLIDIQGSVTGQDGDPGEHSGFVRVKGQLKMLSVDGGLNNTSVLVGADLVNAIIGVGMVDSTISAQGAFNPKMKTGDIAIGSLTVDGSVIRSQILAGYDVEGTALNADASIKSVRVTGNWTASDIVAGIVATDGKFGDSNDTRITGDIDRDGYIATIAKIQILGSVTGTAEADDHFGFVAEQIGSFQVGNTKLALTSLPGEVIELPGTDDVTAREVTV